MKKILLILLVILVSLSCIRTRGIVEARYESGVVINRGGDSKYFRIDYFGHNVMIGDEAIVVGKTLKHPKNFNRVKRVRTL